MKVKVYSNVSFEELYKPSNRRLVLVIGLPGAGSVGRFVASWLKELTDAKLLCKVYSPYFPDQIQLEGGSYELLNYKIYHAEAGGRDVLILTGDFQPDQTSTVAAYEVAEGLIDYMLDLGCGVILIVDGVIGLDGLAVTSNNLDVLRKLIDAGAKPYRGYLSGLQGLLLSLTWFRRNLIGVGVLGGCKDVREDKTAALNALKFINRILGLDLNV